MDRDALWSNGYDESVEVNQRALIDKVLARYSGEFTVFRELLQNSDDAASKAVEIRFESQEYLDRMKSGLGVLPGPIDLKKQVHQWTFRNNGIVFREEDWSRLKKIAEGNPDEEKIGAFGVGFYSLFSVTEEPFVTSGDKWMGFYWKDKKDQLFARRGDLPAAEENDTYRQWTTFQMALREAAPMPTAFDFIRFLTSSITFMAHLQNVTVWFDGHQIAKLVKDIGVPKDLPIPTGLKRTSDLSMMTMIGVKTTSLNISAEVVRLVYTGGSERKPPTKAPPVTQKTPANTGFFSSLFSSFSGGSSSPVPPPPPKLEPVVQIDPMTPVKSHVLLSVFSGEVSVTLNKKMILELHRSTKKNPPTKLKLELIYTGKDEYDASKKDEEGLFEKTGSLFQGLRADLDGTGSARVFIGHATGQTTGIGGHISGRFIPTVERESIDLVDRNVAVWNKELLYVAGLLSRMAYELEMHNIKSLWNAAAEAGKGQPPVELQEWLQNRGLHAMKFFGFHQSTPSAVVSSLIEAAFFGSSMDGSFPIISTAGVMDARSVRRFDPVYSGFLKKLPLLPDEVATGATTMVDHLRSRTMLKDISFQDVINELRARPLTEAEMVECLKWRTSLNTDGIRPAYLAELKREFLDAAILSATDEKGNEQLILLSMIRTYHIPRNATAFLPTDAPFPSHTLPFSLTKQVKADLFNELFGWNELSLPVWLENLVTSPNIPVEFNVTKSPEWAERLFSVLARAWTSIPKEQHAQIIALLQDKPCIPTKQGMKLPSESYFLNANVFSDLPIIAMPKGTIVKGTLEKMLLALGVQQHVDLQIVFSRMIRTGDWSMHDLIKYLVAVENSLTDIEVTRLRETVAFAREEPGNPPPTNGEGATTPAPNVPPKQRYRARDLYEPTNALQELGLPVLAWDRGQKWRSSSDEARFMFKIGLKKHPELKELLELVAGPNAQIRQAALKYLFDGLPTKYSHYDPIFFDKIPYIPAKKPDGTFFLSTPLEVFTDSEYSTMGFSVVDPQLPQDWVTKLKLKPHPPVRMILLVLKGTPPKDTVTARKWFDLLAGRLSDFTSSDLQHLSSVDFIPVIQSVASQSGATNGSTQPRIVLFSPNRCYVSKDATNAFHSQLFTYVDFGSRANSFLMACGVRNEPTVEELAQMLIANPRHFFKLAGGYEQFLVELRRIAVNFRGVTIATRNQMKKTACLVASKRVARSDGQTQKADKDEEEENKLETDLVVPGQIAIVDDTTSYMMFDNIWTAPQEDIVEELYAALGSPLFSSIVKEEYKPSAEIRDSHRAAQLRVLILERLPLFLHERMHSKPSVTYDWLSKDGNFVVIEVGKLTLTRTLQFGSTKMVRSQEAFATASRKVRGPVVMWIGANTQLDYYEVANSLCRVILNYHKPNDSLLFMTILSTDLRALRRRGFNVDRVLRHQQAEKDKQAARERQLVSEISKATGNMGGQQPPPGQPPPKTEIVSNDQSPGPSKGGGLFSNFKLRKPVKPGSSPTPSMPGGTPEPPNPVAPYGKGPVWNADQGVTPHANIERNVRSAIDACRPEAQGVIQSPENMTVIKEAMDEGYCDVMGAINLDLVGIMGMFKVFVSSQGPPNAKAQVESMRPEIRRFGDLVLQPLINLYGLQATSVHIFYDWTGPLIAFNRNGSLFVNLRYYKAWHDQDVQNGNKAQAYTSWYFSLAHEIAHNLVKPHNSEHEFYFSTICEQHMVKLATLITSGDPTPQIGTAW